jgi:hypothetical protein
MIQYGAPEPKKKELDKKLSRNYHGLTSSLSNRVTFHVVSMLGADRLIRYIILLPSSTAMPAQPCGTI